MSLSNIFVEKRLPIIALSLGVVAIAGSLIVGLSTMRATSREIENQIKQNYLLQSEYLASLAEPVHGLSDSALLAQITEVWEVEREKPADEYICIVDESATLILHSAAPQTVGNYAGSNCLTGSKGEVTSDLIHLVGKSAPYVGGYIASSGEQQIAAFSPIQSRGWVIGVHRSSQAIKDIISEKLSSQFLGMLIISLGIIPLSFGLLFMTFLRINKKQKLVAEQLRESEEKYKTIFNDSSDAITLLDENGFIDCNPQTLEMFGIKNRSDFLGTHPSDFSPSHQPEGKSSFELSNEHIKTAFEKGSIRTGWTHRRLNDEEFPAEVLLTAITFGGKRVLQGTIHDITERKRAEQEILYQASLLEQIKSAIFTIDFDYHIISWNKAAEQVYQWQSHEVIGENIIELLSHPESRNEVKTYFESLNKRGEQEDEFYVTRKDGKIIPVQLANTKLKDSSGKHIGFIGVSADISERKQAERGLIRSESVNRAITQTAADAIITIDSEGLILSWNKASERIFGFSTATMIGQSLSSIIPKNYLKDHTQGVKVLLRGKPKSITGKTVELTALRSDGSEFPIELSLSSWNTGDEVHYTGIIRDITDRVDAEQKRIDLENQLRQAQKLEAIGTLAGGIAHDFNNILQAQFLYTGIMERQIGDDEKLGEYLQHIVDAGKRARDLVAQILTFSRQSDVDYERVKIQDILRDSLELMKSALPSNIHITEHIDLDADPVKGDRIQIQQIILNLCNNAYQAIEDSEGEIEVSYKQLRTKNKGDVLDTHFVAAKGVELLVRDNGHGMSPEVLTKIFDPFFTTKDSDHGTGLGLATAYGIIKEMGGQIDVSSKVGQGSTFKIWLPVLDDHETSSDVERILLTEENQRTVLFIDDEEAIRESAKEVLERNGYKVAVDPSGVAALARVKDRAEKFDIIITDYTMPGISGLDLSKEALAVYPDTAIIMMSGNVDKKLLDGCKTLGIKRVLQKPWTEDSLLKHLNIR